MYNHACHCNLCKKSIPYRHTVRVKRICSTEEKLNNNRLEQIKQWLVNRGYRNWKSQIGRENCFVSKTRQKSWR